MAFGFWPRQAFILISCLGASQKTRKELETKDSVGLELERTHLADDGMSGISRSEKAIRTSTKY